MKRVVARSGLIAHDPREDFVRVLDWNVEQLPYVMELEFCEFGSLAAWIEGYGAGAPLGERIDLAAQVADARKRDA